MQQNSLYLRQALAIGVDAYILKEDLMESNDIVSGVMQGSIALQLLPAYRDISGTGLSRG